MNAIDEITVDTVKQNQAFVNITAFLEFNTSSCLEQLLNEYISYIARLSKTYYKKYGVCLDDIICEALVAFAMRFKDYPDTTHFKSYNEVTVCKYIRNHIISYCEQETKKEKIEKQKLERYIKYMK